MNDHNVYISGALMGATDLARVKRLYDYVADICSENGLTPYLPHNNTDPVLNEDYTDAEVFARDYNAMINSSLVISYIGEPSLGVGAELNICVSKDIPIITICERRRKVSRFLKGMLASSKSVQIVEYDDEIELKIELTKHLQR